MFITQILFEYCIILPAFQEAGLHPNLEGSYIFWLALSSVLIAAGGNIINDYFDINIDLINKQQKVIISRYIHRHWAILFHILLSLAGVLLGCWIEYRTHSYLLGITNLLCVCLLFVYSIVLKRKPLSWVVRFACAHRWWGKLPELSPIRPLALSFCRTLSSVFVEQSRIILLPRRQL